MYVLVGRDAKYAPQVYIPELLLLNELIMNVVMLPITGCAVPVVTNPSGLVNAVFTVTGTSTAGLNSTAQVRVTSDPKGGIGLAMLLDSITKVGAGTAKLSDRNGRQF